MRKVSLLVLVLLLLISGCTSERGNVSDRSALDMLYPTESVYTGVPRILSLNSIQAYNELITAATFDESKLEAYLSDNNYSMNGIQTKEEILLLEKIITSVPFPVCKDAQLTVFEINMDYPSMFIRYCTDSQKTVQFRVYLNTLETEEKLAKALDTSGTMVEPLLAESMQSLYYMGPSERTATNVLTYVANVDGYFVSIEIFDASRSNADICVQSVSFDSLS